MNELHLAGGLETIPNPPDPISSELIFLGGSKLLLRLLLRLILFRSVLLNLLNRSFLKSIA